MQLYETDYYPKLKRWLSFSLFCAKGNFRKWVQAGLFPAATSALGWQGSRTQEHMPCDQQHQSNFLDITSPFWLCDDHKKSFRLQQEPSVLTLQILGGKLPDSTGAHTICGANSVSYEPVRFYVLRSPVFLLFLNRHPSLISDFKTWPWGLSLDITCSEGFDSVPCSTGHVIASIVSIPLIYSWCCNHDHWMDLTPSSFRGPNHQGHLMDLTTVVQE